MSIAFDLEEAISFLGRTPKVLMTQLSGLSEKWASSNEGEKTWNSYQVLGHLVYGEDTDWIPRTKIILEYGLEKEFVPFDRFAQDQLYKDKSIDELLDLFAAKRAANLETLRSLHLTNKDLERKGNHPEFGEITLREMLAAWTVHDMGHVVQLNRILAKGYKEEIGPWKKYLTIVRSRPAPEE